MHMCVFVCVHNFMQVDSHMVGWHITCLLGHASTRWLICLQYMHCVGVWWCIDGSVLLTHRTPGSEVKAVCDFLLSHQMEDGGWVRISL